MANRRTRQPRNSNQSSAQLDAPKPEGEVVAEFIEAFCRLSKGDGAGELIKLRPWQREILMELFSHREDGRRKYRRGLLLMPRKNSKSLLASGIALYSLFTEIGAEVARRLNAPTLKAGLVTFPCELRPRQTT